MNEVSLYYFCDGPSLQKFCFLYFFGVSLIALDNIIAIFLRALLMLVLSVSLREVSLYDPEPRKIKTS